jgi:hypothetical protein
MKLWWVLWYYQDQYQSTYQGCSLLPPQLMLHHVGLFFQIWGKPCWLDLSFTASHSLHCQVLRIWIQPSTVCCTDYTIKLPKIKVLKFCRYQIYSCIELHIQVLNLPILL